MIGYIIKIDTVYLSKKSMLYLKCNLTKNKNNKIIAIFTTRKGGRELIYRTKIIIIKLSFLDNIFSLRITNY